MGKSGRIKSSEPNAKRLVEAFSNGKNPGQLKLGQRPSPRKAIAIRDEITSTRELVDFFAEQPKSVRESWPVLEEELALKTTDFASLEKQLQGLKGRARKEAIRNFAADFLPKAEAQGFLAADVPASIRALTAKAEQQEKAFFALPQEVKNLFESRGKEREYDGYRSLEYHIRERKDKESSVTDHKELFHLGGLHSCWTADEAKLAALDISGLPPQLKALIDERRSKGFQLHIEHILPNFIRDITAVQNAYHGLTRLILEVIEAGYGFPEGILTEAFDLGEQSSTRSLNYLPLTDQFIKDQDVPDWQKNLWAQSHFDKSMLTFLKLEKGLQLLGEQNGHPVWVPIKTDPGKIVMNFGLPLQVFTGGKLPATAHRVVILPEMAKTGRRTRPLFFQVAGSTLLRPVLAKDWTSFPKSMTIEEMLNTGSERYLKMQQEERRKLAARQAYLKDTEPK